MTVVREGAVMKTADSGERQPSGCRFFPVTPAAGRLPLAKDSSEQRKG
jgi:hypothetical protein